MCRKVVAEQRGLGGEPVTGQLHAVAGVPGEPDDDLLELLPVVRSAVAASTHPAAFRLVYGEFLLSRRHYCIFLR